MNLQLTHCDIGTPYGDGNSITIVSDASLLPNGTEPLPELVLNYQQ